MQFSKASYGVIVGETDGQILNGSTLRYLPSGDQIGGGSAVINSIALAGASVIRNLRMFLLFEDLVAPEEGTIGLEVSAVEHPCTPTVQENDAVNTLYSLPGPIDIEAGQEVSLFHRHDAAVQREINVKYAFEILVR